MTNITFVKEHSNAKCEIFDVKSRFIDEVPLWVFEHLPRFGKIDIIESKRQLEIYFCDGIGAGLSAKAYRVFERFDNDGEKEIVVDPGFKMLFKFFDGDNDFYFDSKNFKVDIDVCGWLYKTIFDTNS